MLSSSVEHHPEPVTPAQVELLCVKQMYSPSMEGHARVLRDARWVGVSVQPWMRNTVFNVEMCKKILSEIGKNGRVEVDYAPVLYTPILPEGPRRRVRARKSRVCVTIRYEARDPDEPEETRDSSDAESSNGSIDYEEISEEEEETFVDVGPSSPCVTCD